jgi:hypothetical protein
MLAEVRPAVVAVASNVLARARQSSVGAFIADVRVRKGAGKSQNQVQGGSHVVR